MRKSKYTDNQNLAILKQNEHGVAVPELCREHDLSTATFYKWRTKFGGMDASLMQHLKALEEENRRLKKCMPKNDSRRKSARRHLREGGKAIST